MDPMATSHSASEESATPRGRAGDSRGLPSSGRRARSRCAHNREAGIAILEILISSIVVGTAAIGIALMFSTGSAWVASGGDKRAATMLAQQKVEQLRSMTFACVPLGPPEASSTSTSVKAATGGACTATQKYNEGPTTWVTATGGPAPQPTPTSLTFTRLTCVQHVLDTDFGTPAYTGVVATNLPCNPYVDTNTSLSCATQGGTCQPTNTKRIVVIVQPTRTTEKAAPVRLQAWITATPGGI